MSEIIYCDVDQLEHDPDNPRRLYIDKDLHRLAETIYVNGGVDQALLVRPSGRLEDGRRRYLVVDGNYRLAAARTLGHKAPRLKCELLRSMSRKRKLMIMGRTSEQHYPRDPISEAIYYRKLIEEEEISRIALSRNIGCSTAKIANRLSLLELDDEIQELVAENKLPKDPRIVKAFMCIPSKEKRIQLAREVARRNASIRAIIVACSRLRRHLNSEKASQAAVELLQEGLPECIAIALSSQPSQPPDRASKCKWGDVRQKAKEVCEVCDLKMGTLDGFEEPGWSLFCQAGEETCDVCSLREIQSVCQGCPLPEFLVRMSRILQARKEVQVQEGA